MVLEPPIVSLPRFVTPPASSPPLVRMELEPFMVRVPSL